MASTPKYTQTRQKKGLFVDGVWNCNCEPRLPASRFQVKKDGANRGRWFYTCQEPKESGCGFFLWDDAAKPREMGAIIGNSRSEVDAFKTPADASRDARTDLNTVEGHIAASNKWMADLGKKDEDEFGDWDLSPEDELALTAAASSPVMPAGAQMPPTTPRKVDHDLRTGVKRKRAGSAWLTPTTGNDDTPRLKGYMWDGNERPTAGLMSPAATPTPLRFHDTSQLQHEHSEADLTREVLDILADQSINPATTTVLIDLLNKHALKMTGIVRGRDITRLALKTKDAKIAEFQQRISTLESEREMDKLIIRNMKADITHSVSNRRGRGRGRAS